MLFLRRHDLIETQLFLDIHFPITGIDIYQQKANFGILDCYWLKLQLITIPKIYVHHRMIAELMVCKIEVIRQGILY